MIYDLHTHTTASDGKLDVASLLERARRFSVDIIAITDHDTVAACLEVNDHDLTNIKLVTGIEFSTQWRKTEIHIVGLNINPEDNSLIQLIHQQSGYRFLRAQRIAKKLARLNVDSPLEGAMKHANNNNIGRPHFAEYLVASGFTPDFQRAFKRYLAVGKPAYVRPEWTNMDNIIETIIQAGGVAVLAHPAKYNFTRTRLLELLSEFRELGGMAMEVISGRQIPSLTRDLAGHCNKMGLYASCGSDFHQAGQAWAELGQFSKIPGDCKPVWDLWQ